MFNILQHFLLFAWWQVETSEQENRVAPESKRERWQSQGELAFVLDE